MIITTTPYLAGHQVVEMKGHAFGLVVPSRGLGGNIMAGFRSTDEVFVDPATRRRMRVLLDPATGERRYIAED